MKSIQYIWHAMHDKQSIEKAALEAAQKLEIEYETFCNILNNNTLTESILVLSMHIEKETREYYKALINEKSYFWDLYDYIRGQIKKAFYIIENNKNIQQQNIYDAENLFDANFLVSDCLELERRTLYYNDMNYGIYKHKHSVYWDKYDNIQEYMLDCIHKFRNK